MLIAVGILVLIIVTVLFHFLSPWWLTPIASNWTALDANLNLTFLITGIVFLVVNLFLVWTIVKYRHREGSKAHYEPENKKLEFWLHTEPMILEWENKSFTVMV